MPGSLFNANREEIGEQLERILSSKGFRQAPRVRELLRFVVAQSLDGNETILKETTIGVHVFGRDPSYDTSKDSVVRTTAARVRQRLAAYYETTGRGDLWIISLPDEGYVPRISPAAPAPAPDAAYQAPHPVQPKRSISRKALVAITLILTACSLAFRAWTGRKPVVIAAIPLTHDGLPKVGPIVTDGSRLYFQELIGTQHVPSSTPMGGGAVTHVDIPNLLGPVVLDFSNESREFLLYNDSWPGEGGLWTWTPGSAPAPLNTNGVGAWIPPSHFARVFAGELRIMETQDPGVSRLVAVPGMVQSPHWLPLRHQLRFTVGDLSQEKYSLWELDGINGTPKPLPDYPPNARNGTWAANGRLFVFQSSSNPADRSGDLWAADETTLSLFGKNAKPVRLTQGPIDYSSPVPDADGKAVFAIGTLEEMELVRYDSASGEYLPFLPGVSGTEPDFSRSNGWVTYSAYPDRTLWKARSNGSGAVQLTFPPMIAVQPHWSPDGSQVAFMGQVPGKHWRIYLVPSAGGAPREATDFPVEQGVPTWNPDGKQIVFGERRMARPDSEMELHILDLSTKRVSTIPGSKGAWTARWSPNGNFIAATSTDVHRLLLFDCRSQAWRTLISLKAVDDPVWSADSAYLYFFGIQAPKTSDDPHGPSAIYRVDLRTMKIETAVDLSRSSPIGFPWNGLAPDGTPIAARPRSIQEIYKLTLQY